MTVDAKSRRSTKKLTVAEIRRILALHALGHDKLEIARLTNRHEATVRQVLIGVRMPVSPRTNQPESEDRSLRPAAIRAQSGTDDWWMENQRSFVAGMAAAGYAQTEPKRWEWQP